MGMLFKFGQAVHEIFKFLYLQNRDFLDYLVRIFYKWVFQNWNGTKITPFFKFLLKYE